MENNNVNVNKADAIFIPENIEGDRSDYTEYKVGLFRSVPANCYLVTVNVLNGNIVNKGVSGLKFTLPFITKSILVPNINRTIDYPKAGYLTLDNITANVDIALGVKIVDPVKYIKEGRFQLEHLNVLTQSLLRVYVQSFNFHSLSSGVCPLNMFDPTDQFGAYEENYGIKINKVVLKEIKLPNDLQKQYDDVVEAKKRREKQAIDLEAKKDEARTRKEISEMDAESYLMKYEKLVSYFVSQGIPVEGIAELVKMQMVAENPNAQFYFGDSGIARDIAAGMNGANNKVHTRTKTKQ